MVRSFHEHIRQLFVTANHKRVDKKSCLLVPGMASNNVSNVNNFRLEAEIYSTIDESWENFKRKFEKVYKDAEDTRRRKIWESNIECINKHNLEYRQGLHSYTMGENHFADQTQEEYAGTCLGCLPPEDDEAVSILDHLACAESASVPMNMGPKNSEET